MNDAELRELYARMVARGGDDRAGCVPPEKMLDLVERRGPESERLEVLDHVMACRACREEFELLRTLAEERPRERRWPVRPLAVAASIALVVGAVAIWQAQQGGPGPDVTRGPGAAALVGPVGELPPGTAVRFVWRPVTDAVEYELVVSDADGAEVWKATTRDTTLALPEATTLTPGTVYLWWVRARFADGRLSEAPPQRFAVAPDRP